MSLGGNPRSRARAFSCFLLSCALASCSATGPQPWVKNGKRVGTTRVEELSGGHSRKLFIDNGGRLVRVERYGPTGEPESGAWISTIRYEGNLPVAREEWEAEGTLALGPRGYAAVAFKHEEDRHECTFLGPAGEPVARTDGVHRIVKLHRDWHLREVRFYDLANEPTNSESGASRHYFYRGSKLVEVRLLDTKGEPMSGDFGGVRGATFRYEYIKGVKDIPVVAQHYLDAKGATRGTNLYKQLPSEPNDCN